jgi:hypothetical protein
MEVTVEWHGRSKKFIWPKVKIFRHWWGNKEENEPNDMIELANMDHRPIGAFYDRLKDRFHLFVIKDQETEQVRCREKNCVLVLGYSWMYKEK